jgi:hypothetical protein
MGHVEDPRLMGHASGPISFGFCVRTQISWVRRGDPSLMGPVSGPISLESDVRTQGSWVLSF